MRGGRRAAQGAVKERKKVEKDQSRDRWSKTERGEGREERRGGSKTNVCECEDEREFMLAVAVPGARQMLRHFGWQLVRFCVIPASSTPPNFCNLASVVLLAHKQHGQLQDEQTLALLTSGICVPAHWH